MSPVVVIKIVGRSVPSINKVTWKFIVTILECSEEKIVGIAYWFNYTWRLLKGGQGCVMWGGGYMGFLEVGQRNKP